MPDATLPPLAGSKDFADLPTVDPENYDIGAELARGGVGRIRKARDLRLGRSIALKELLTQEPHAKARFEYEARMTARLQHPAIVNIHEAGKWPTGEPFYAMKMVEGRSLAKVIEDAKTLRERLALLPNVTTVVEALAYAHGQHVIHRDLKPANVLVGAFGETVVIDWGLAKDLSNPSNPDEKTSDGSSRSSGALTATGAVMGTPEYMPPEQARGDPVDERADVYSLGALLYHVLTGAPPYSGPDVQSVLQALAAGPPVPLRKRQPDVPPDLATILEKAMARDPGARYPTAKELAEDLKRFQTGQLVASRYYSSMDLFRRWVKRNRVTFRIACASIGALILVGLGALHFRHQALESAHEQKAVAERQLATRLILQEMQSVRNAAVELSRIPELADVLLKDKGVVAQAIEGHARALHLPASFVQAVNQQGRTVAALGVHIDARWTDIASRADTQWVNPSLAYKRVITMGALSDVLAIRVSVPVLDNGYAVRGAVALTTPMDAAFTNRIRRYLADAEIAIHLGSQRGFSSFGYLPGSRGEVFVPGGATAGYSIRRVGGREYSASYSVLRGIDGKVVGYLGVFLPREGVLSSPSVDSLVAGFVGLCVLACLVLAFRMSRHEALGLLLLMSLSMSACGNEPGSDEARSDALTVVRAADSQDLDPHNVNDAESEEPCAQIYEGLVSFSSDGHTIEPVLATSWETSDQSRIWTFHLRRDVRFHDGTQLDAGAVVESFRRLESTLWRTILFGVIKKVRALDSSTVRFELNRPYSPFLTSLASAAAAIISPAALEKHGRTIGTHPVGTGPFRFVEWVRGKQIVLARNESYWGKKTALRRLIFRAVSDADERLVMLETGAVDIAHDIVQEELPFASLHPDLQVTHTPGHNVLYVALNNERRPFDDVRVRRALNYAINKAALIGIVYHGLAVPAAGPVPPSLWAHRGGAGTYSFDPERARTLLRAALGGRPTPPLQFLAYRNPRPYVPDPVEAAHLIARNLGDVGIEVNLVIQDFNKTRQDITDGKHDLCLMGWIGDMRDPDNFLYPLLTSVADGRTNRAFFQNKEYDALVIRAQETADRNAREDLYRRAQDIVAREAPWIPLVHSEDVLVLRRGVMDVVLRPGLDLNLRDVHLTP